MRHENFCAFPSAASTIAGLIRRSQRREAQRTPTSVQERPKRLRRDEPPRGHGRGSRGAGARGGRGAGRCGLADLFHVSALIRILYIPVSLQHSPTMRHCKTLAWYKHAFRTQTLLTGWGPCRQTSRIGGALSGRLRLRSTTRYRPRRAECATGSTSKATQQSTQLRTLDRARRYRDFTSRLSRGTRGRRRARTKIQHASEEQRTWRLSGSTTKKAGS